MSAQVGMEAIKQQTARQELSFEQGQQVSKMYGDVLAFLESSNMLDDYGAALPGALSVATQVYKQTGDPLAAQQAMLDALGIGTSETVAEEHAGPGMGKWGGTSKEGIA